MCRFTITTVHKKRRKEDLFSLSHPPILLLLRVGRVLPHAREPPPRPPPPPPPPPPPARRAPRRSVSAEHPPQRTFPPRFPVSSGGHRSAAAGGDLSRFSAVVLSLGSPFLFLTCPAPFLSLCVPAFRVSLPRFYLFSSPSSVPISDVCDPLCPVILLLACYVP